MFLIIILIIIFFGNFTKMGDNEEMEEIKIADVKEEIINRQKEQEYHV